MPNNLALVDNITTAVSTQIRAYVGEGSLNLPSNYSADNALKAAMLMLPEIVNNNKVPVLKACSPESIKGALLSMCIQGLNPDKKQCYFIPYGEKLTMTRSYFGDIAVVKQVDPTVLDVYASAVFAGDELEYTIKRGVVVEVKHTQKLENKDKSVKAAYATVIYKDGREISTVMTIDQIKKSWQQSKIKPVDANGKVNPDSTHGKFPEEMAKKTVVHRACKAIIDSSSDSELVRQYAQETQYAANDAEIEEEIDENANTEDFDVIEVDSATGEVLSGGEPF